MFHHVLTAIAGSQVPINYLSRSNPTRLKLIQGETDAFSDVVALINEYEGMRIPPRAALVGVHR